MLGLRPSPWHPTSTRLLANIRPFFPQSSSKHSIVVPRVGIKQDDKMPKGCVYPVALFDTSSVEFPPVTVEHSPDAEIRSRC